LAISNHNSFRVLFDKIASVYLKKINLYFSIRNGQPREPAMWQLYRQSFVPYLKNNFLIVFGYFSFIAVD